MVEEGGPSKRDSEVAREAGRKPGIFHLYNELVTLHQ